MSLGPFNRLAINGVVKVESLQENKMPKNYFRNAATIRSEGLDIFFEKISK
ncbi:MAG: hypothetical protein ACI91R_002673 [Vicingaceae bacterium]